MRRGLAGALLAASTLVAAAPAFAADGTTMLSCTEDPAPAVSATAAQAAGQNVLVRVLGTNERLANGYTLNVEFPP